MLFKQASHIAPTSAFSETSSASFCGADEGAELDDGAGLLLAGGVGCVLGL
jgi:hypothetical protein